MQIRRMRVDHDALWAWVCSEVNWSVAITTLWIVPRVCMVGMSERLRIQAVTGLNDTSNFNLHRCRSINSADPLYATWWKLPEDRWPDLSAFIRGWSRSRRTSADRTKLIRPTTIAVATMCCQQSASWLHGGRRPPSGGFQSRVRFINWHVWASLSTRQREKKNRSGNVRRHYLYAGYIVTLIIAQMHEGREIELFTKYTCTNIY